MGGQLPHVASKVCFAAMPRPICRWRRHMVANVPAKAKYVDMSPWDQVCPGFSQPALTSTGKRLH
jgi:hypothetical protein